MKRFIKQLNNVQAAQLTAFWLCTFCLLIVLSQTGQGQHSIDVRVNSFFLENRQEWIITIMKKITLLGDWIGALASISIVALLAASKNKSRNTALFTTAFVAGSALVGYVISQSVKAITARTRPADRLVEIDSFAFPSGHATTAFALYFLVALLLAHSTDSPKIRRLVVTTGIL